MSESFDDFMAASSAMGITGIRPNRVRDRLNGTIFKIAGCLWPVRFKHRLLERHQVLGQADLFNNNIIIEGNLKEAETLTAIWHEILEVLNKKYDIDMSHEILSRLETHVFEALVNNPQFLQELLIYAKRYNGVNKTVKKTKE
jgi:hypothetical protein